MESKGDRRLMSACQKLVACLSVPEATFHLTSHVRVFQEAPTFPSFCAPVLPAPGGCAPFLAVREGFAATPLHLPSLPSAAFLFVLAVVSQISKSHLLGMVALLPSVSVGSTFWVPFCFEWNSWVYSAALSQLV